MFFLLWLVAVTSFNWKKLFAVELIRKPKVTAIDAQQKERDIRLSLPEKIWHFILTNLLRVEFLFVTFVFLLNRQERTGKTVLSAEDHMDDGSRIKLTISIDEKEVDSLHMRTWNSSSI